MPPAIEKREPESGAGLGGSGGSEQEAVCVSQTKLLFGGPPLRKELRDVPPRCRLEEYWRIRQAPSERLLGPRRPYLLY
jgi:hypothetical protein